MLLGRYKLQALAGGSSGAESQHRQSKLGDPEEEPGDAEHCPTGMDTPHREEQHTGHLLRVRRPHGTPFTGEPQEKVQMQPR